MKENSIKIFFKNIFTKPELIYANALKVLKQNQKPELKKIFLSGQDSGVK